MTRLIDLLLTTDRHQRVRLAQSALASLLMLACVLAMHLATAAGLNDGRWLWPWTTVSLLGLLAVFALIRCGWSLRLSDPSMTVAQMLYAIACAAAGYAIAGAAHGAVPLILALVLMFGMFGLTQAQVLFVGSYSLLLFGAVMAAMSRQDPQHYPPQVEVVYFLLSAIVVWGVIVLSSRLATMRERLRTQRHELELAVARIGELATHDELTGLINRRRMQELLEQDRRRSQRAGHPWCLALLDIDHFKRVNDQHGHAAGDEVLRALARVGMAQVRKNDVLARWGGEEFVLLLQDIGPAMAHVAVERLRQRVIAEPVPLDGLALPITFSAGLTQHVVGETVEQTLGRADRALYEAKAQGRNRIVTA
jgi:diguanylate cyclase (GGDEF)-like protein